MSKSNISLTKLTKTCNSCGQQKPLSAFLQITGAEGSNYGNICSSCRKANIEKPATPEEPEESTTSRTGVKIDSKAKVQAEIDKREARKQNQETDFEEREKKDEEEIHRVQKIETITHDEKKRRLNFLDNRPYLDGSKKTSFDKVSHVFGGQDQVAEAGKLDFTTVTQDATQEKVKSPIYQAFKGWLGDSLIVSAAERAIRQRNKNKYNKTAENPTTAPGTDPLDEYIHKNRGPGSKK